MQPYDRITIRHVKKPAYSLWYVMGWVGRRGFTLAVCLKEEMARSVRQAILQSRRRSAQPSRPPARTLQLSA